MGGKSPRPIDQAAIEAQQKRAAEEERTKLAQEEAAGQLKTQQKMAEKESQRRAFAGQLSEVDDEEERRKFLKGA